MGSVLKSRNFEFDLVHGNVFGGDSMPGFGCVIDDRDNIHNSFQEILCTNAGVFLVEEIE